MESFEAPIVAADKGGAFVVVPEEVVAALGGKGRIAVNATFDGVPYRGSVVSMGGPKVIGVLKGIREEIGKGPGDTLRVTLEVDAAERKVEVPDDVAAALGKAGLQEAFGRLSYSHQREYVEWVGEAKKPETRDRRIEKTIQRLQASSSYDGPADRKDR
jgi:hypothetical protein